MNNLITLQLSLPALEKLFEGDPQFALSLKQSAIAEFARRKMGDLLTKAAKADIDAAIAQQIGMISNASYQPKITLQEPILQQIRSETRTTMDGHQTTITKIIQETAQKVMDEKIGEIEARITREIERRITSEITTRISDGIKAGIDAMIKAVRP